MPKLKNLDQEAMLVAAVRISLATLTLCCAFILYTCIWS